MARAQQPAEPERFRGWIARRLGLHFDDTQLEFLAEMAGRHADQTGVPLQTYLDRLEARDSDSELKSLVLELTVPETYFFRHIEQLNAFVEVVLPSAQRALATPRKLSVLSAGCASGEEPYSIAMLLREQGVDCAGSVAIRAVDMNASMLSKAARGRYSAWALRETPTDFRQRWFRSVGQELLLDESIRNAVSFQEINLAQENAGLWVPNSYDVIFCRNVLMYFTSRSAQTLIARMTRSLVPGGYLFLGHAETLRGLSHDYHLCHTHGTFYYQRKEERTNGHAPLRPAPTVEPVLTAATLVSEEACSNTWLEAIQRTSDRIQALTGRPHAVAADPRRNADAISAVQTATQLQLALELLKQERFSDALDLLAWVPSDSGQDPDVLLLRAALLTHSGQLSAAESVSARLLERDEMNTGAHYLLALCRESAGDRERALDHDRSAIYLDPGFAMPRLHLGLMARRAHNWEEARQELGQALLLLKREDASRLLLFGGGFGREALIALCRAELLSAGGLP